MRWIESQTHEIPESGIQFLPLPKGEGWGEGEGDVIHNCASHPEIYLGNSSKNSIQKNVAITAQ